MKKIICALFLFCSCLISAFSYASKKNIQDSELVVLEGFVKCYGNEPFVYLGLNTADESFYRIVASEEIISELFEKQGSEVKVFGNHLQNSIENTLLFEVKKVEVKK